MFIPYIVISSDSRDEATDSFAIVLVPLLDYITASDIETNPFKEDPQETGYDSKDYSEEDPSKEDPLEDDEDEPLPAQETGYDPKDYLEEDPSEEDPSEDEEDEPLLAQTRSPSPPTKDTIAEATTEAATLPPRKRFCMTSLHPVAIAEAMAKATTPRRRLTARH
ncbi:hypothetical protein Tco_0795820 [Tanacetum coccineum]